MSVDNIINSAFSEIEKSEAFFAFIESAEKSEDLLLEAGYAKALDKKGVNLRFLRSLTDIIIEFEDSSNLKEEIRNKLKYN